MKKFTLLFVLLLTNLALFSRTEKYRLVLNDDPATTMTIGWEPVLSLNATVYYGKENLGTNDPSQYTSHGIDRITFPVLHVSQFANLENLEPDTRYYFFIQDQDGPSPMFYFETLPDNPDTPLVFIAGGDSRNNRDPRQSANVVVSKLQADAIFFGGDFTDLSTPEQWENWLNDWQLTIAEDGRMTPIVGTRGNHEYIPGTVNGFFDTPGPILGEYYSLQFGGNLVRTYTLNTEIPTGGAQTEWLQEDLENNPNTFWKFAQYHKPMRPHEPGKAEGDGQYDNWAQLFYDHKVRLVVECDAHVVKSTWPIRPSNEPGSVEGFISDPANGTVYVGEGCWGAPTRSSSDTKPWTRSAGSFNQIKLLHVSKEKVETRTILVPDNAELARNEITRLMPDQKYDLPLGMNFWNPSTGEVVALTNAPVVFFQKPAKALQLALNSTLPVTVSAATPAGNITKVELYKNGVKVGEDLTAPYEFEPFFNGIGTFELTAIAYGDNGLSTRSEILDVLVGNVLSEISLPVETVAFDAGSEILIDPETVDQSGDYLFRFSTENLINGLHITEAYIQFKGVDATGGNSNAEISAIKTDIGFSLAEAFSSNQETDQSQTWDIPAFPASELSTEKQQSSDLALVLNEVFRNQLWKNTVPLDLLVNFTLPEQLHLYSEIDSLRPELVVKFDFLDEAQFARGPGLRFNSVPKSLVAEESGLITAEVSQGTSAIDSVVFSINNEQVAVDKIAPFEYPFIPTVNGLFDVSAQVFDKNGLNAYSDISQVIVRNKTSVITESIPVNSTNDDAEEYVLGTIELVSTDLELTLAEGVSGFDGQQTVGVRFNEIPLGSGVELVDAKLRFFAKDDNDDPGELFIQIENSPNPAPFTADMFSLTQRSKSLEQVQWSPGEFPRSGPVETPSISGLVSSIVDDPAWTNGGSLAFYISGIARKSTWSYDGRASEAPEFVVDYRFTDYNLAPVVELPNLLDGDTYAAENTPDLTISGSDADGTVEEYVLFIDGNEVERVSGSSPAFTYQPTNSGKYLAQVMAIDNNGREGRSRTYSFVYGLGSAPFISWITPTETVDLNALVPVQLEVDAIDGDGTIKQVEFLVRRMGETFSTIQIDSTSPYSAEFLPTEFGVYEVKAVTTDNIGETTETDLQLIKIIGGTAPIATFIRPFNGQIFPKNSVFNALVEASDLDGSVTQVQFFKDGILLGTKLDAPYEIEINTLENGVFDLSAVITDNSGKQSTISLNYLVADNSIPSLTIISPIENQRIAAGSLQQIKLEAFDNDGSITDLEVSINGSFFGEVALVQQVLAWTPLEPGTYTIQATATDNMGASTTKEVQVQVFENKAPIAEVLIPESSPITVDQGANSSFLIRALDPDGVISKVKMFDENGFVSEAQLAPFRFNYNFNEVGVTTVRFIAYDNFNKPSSPVSVDANVKANALPEVVVLNPGFNETLLLNEAITLRASANDPDGSIEFVDFIVNGVRIGTDETAPYTMTYTPRSIGVLTVQARAMDNKAALATSNVITVSVRNNEAPTVTLNSPSTSITVSPNEIVNFSASAMDPDGSVQVVKFYVNNNLVRNFTAAPYAFEYMFSEVGEYAVKVEAIDNEGNNAEDGPVIVKVSNNQLPIVEINSPIQNETISSGSNVTAEVLVNDPDGSAPTTELYLNGDLIDTKSEEGELVFNLGMLEDAEYNILAISTDERGGITSSETVQFVVGNTATSIQENTTSVQVYPTLVSSVLQVRGNQNNHFRIFNSNGKLVLEGSMLHQQISVSELVNGIYRIEIDQSTYPFVKQ